MIARAYAHALHDTIEAGTVPAEELVTRLKALLQRRGHYKLLPQIVSELEHITQRERADVPTVALARESDKATLAQHIENAASALVIDPRDLAYTTDSTLISGFTMTAGTKRYDASQKRALINLYHTLTT